MKMATRTSNNTDRLNTQITLSNSLVRLTASIESTLLDLSSHAWKPMETIKYYRLMIFVKSSLKLRVECAVLELELTEEQFNYLE